MIRVGPRYLSSLLILTVASGLALPARAQEVDGFLLIATCLLERLLAIAHPGARAGAKGGDVFRCDHRCTHMVDQLPVLLSCFCF